MPGETSKSIAVKFSKDIRREDNRLLILDIDDALVGAEKGSAGSKEFLISKADNPLPPAGAPTFTQLMNTSSGVLGINCLKCHNSVQLNGGFDLANFDLLIQNSIVIPGSIESKMYYRMNPSAPGYQNNNSMPLDGALPVLERREVEAWIRAGGLNN
jgi:hypothetical protein